MFVVNSMYGFVNDASRRIENSFDIALQGLRVLEKLLQATSIPYVLVCLRVYVVSLLKLVLLCFVVSFFKLVFICVYQWMRSMGCSPATVNVPRVKHSLWPLMQHFAVAEDVNSLSCESRKISCITSTACTASSCVIVMTGHTSSKFFRTSGGNLSAMSVKTILGRKGGSSSVRKDWHTGLMSQAWLHRLCVFVCLCVCSMPY